MIGYRPGDLGIVKVGTGLNLYYGWTPLYVVDPVKSGFLKIHRITDLIDSVYCSSVSST